jgi:hypothetical protein
MLGTLVIPYTIQAPNDLHIRVTGVVDGCWLQGHASGKPYCHSLNGCRIQAIKGLGTAISPISPSPCLTQQLCRDTSRAEVPQTDSDTMEERRPG